MRPWRAQESNDRASIFRLSIPLFFFLTATGCAVAESGMMDTRRSDGGLGDAVNARPDASTTDAVDTRPDAADVATGDYGSATGVLTGAPTSIYGGVSRFGTSVD
jgi:hypothetical protein